MQSSICCSSQGRHLVDTRQRLNTTRPPVWLMTPLCAGDSCDDGDKCTEQDTCAGGTCAGKPKTCPAPADQCQISVCDAATGDCRTENKPDNSSCTLGGGSAGLCRADTCQAGRCMAGPENDCSALNDACNDGKCDPGTGR